MLCCTGCVLSASCEKSHTITYGAGLAALHAFYLLCKAEAHKNIPTKALLLLSVAACTCIMQTHGSAFRVASFVGLCLFRFQQAGE